MTIDSVDKKPHRRRPSARQHEDRSLERALSGVISRLAKLDAFTRRLRERLEAGNGDLALRSSLDFVTREIEAGERALEARAATLRWPGSRAPFVSLPYGQKATATAPLSKLVARLAAGVKSCGKRLCALLRAALAMGDLACAQTACAILRVLEKELWLLRPRAGAAPSFVTLPYNFNVF